MSSQTSLGPDSAFHLPANQFGMKPGGASASGRFYAEDGWIFREYPGKGIEIICRYEPSAADAAKVEKQAGV